MSATGGTVIVVPTPTITRSHSDEPVQLDGDAVDATIVDADAQTGEVLRNERDD